MQRRLIYAAAAIVIVVIGVIAFTGGDDGHKIKVELKDAGGLRKNSSVKVAGVPAGKVTDLTVTKQDHAIATLQIDDNAWPIGQDASVAVRPTDLLGERYAALTAGDPSKPLSDGDLIPIAKTSTPVELDDILNTLDADTRTRLGILVNEVGIGLEGRGTDFGKLLSELPPSLDQTGKLIDQVASQDKAIRAMILKGDRITAAVDNKRDDMGALVDAGAAALQTVADKRRELGNTIENAPGGLAQLRDTLTHLDAASTSLRPALTDLKATAGPLAGTLDELPDFADEANPTLKTAVKVSPTLTKLGRQATPTLKKLRPTARLLNRTLVSAAPALQHMTDRGTDDLLYFINNINYSLNNRDGLSHFIGAKIYFDSEMVTDAINAFNGYKPAAAKSKGTPAKVPDAVKNVTDGVKKTVDDTKKKLPLKNVTDGVKKITDDVNKTLKPITGDTTKGITDAVNGVLGRISSDSQTSKQKGGDATQLFNYLMGP